MAKDGTATKAWDWWDTAEWRAQQSEVDSDIENLSAYDAEFKAYAESLAAQGLPLEDELKRLGEFARQRADRKLNQRL